jgi:hypothetical protein
MHPGACTHPLRTRTQRSRIRYLSRSRTHVRIHATPAFTHDGPRIRNKGRVNAGSAAYTQRGTRPRSHGGVDERCGAAADADDDGYRFEHAHYEDDVHHLLLFAHETVDLFWSSWQFVVDALTAVQTAASRLGVRDCALSMRDHAWLVLAVLLRPFVRTPGFFERRCLARALRISPTSGR